MTLLAVCCAAAAGWLALPNPRGPTSSGRPLLRVLAAVGLGGGLLLLPHSLLALAALVTATLVVGERVWRRRQAGREAETNAALMAEVCDLLAAELAAGRPPEQALGEAATAWSAIRPVADACRLGGDVPHAFRDLAHTPGAGGLRLLAAAWSVSQRTGGGLASATRRVAGAVRRDQATRRLVAGELASARATARLVAALPVVALLMGSGAGGDPWSFLFRTPAGLCCLGAGLAIGLLGLWWIELIAREVDS